MDADLIGDKRSGKFSPATVHVLPGIQPLTISLINPLPPILYFHRNCSVSLPPPPQTATGHSYEKRHSCMIVILALEEDDHILQETFFGGGAFMSGRGGSEHDFFVTHTFFYEISINAYIFYILNILPVQPTCMHADSTELTPLDFHSPHSYYVDV